MTNGNKYFQTICLSNVRLLSKTPNIFFSQKSDRARGIIFIYIMAIGFSYRYFGMQANSDSERRILFSIWSPQETDDTSSISKENAVILVFKDEQTVINAFGNEGSGEQSNLVYPWVAGVAFKFKLEGKLSKNGYSIFSVYFNDPTKSEDYIFIAQWKRPKTQSYLNGLYSFLENFSHENGHISRKTYFNNQIALNYQSEEIKLLSVSFSQDYTASQQQRLDYDGRVNNVNGYYLLETVAF